MKIKCDCGELAVWFYMPGDGACCDDCVPRGCTCNKYPIDEDYENLKEENWEEDLDTDGRLLPCCEWDYEEEGWDE